MNDQSTMSAEGTDTVHEPNTQIDEAGAAETTNVAEAKSKVPKKKKLAVASAQPKRHRRTANHPHADVASIPLGRRAAMRMAIRAGAGRVDRDVPRTIQALVGAVTTALMRSAVCFAEHSRRRTILLEDVSLAVSQAFRRQLYHGELTAWK